MHFPPAEKRKCCEDGTEKPGDWETEDVKGFPLRTVDQFNKPNKRRYLRGCLEVRYNASLPAVNYERGTCLTASLEPSVRSGHTCIVRC